MGDALGMNTRLKARYLQCGTRQQGVAHQQPCGWRRADESVQLTCRRISDQVWRSLEVTSTPKLWER